MSRGWQRLWTCLAVLGLLFGAGLIGSAGAGAQGDPVKITFWNYWDGTNGEAIQSLVDRYNDEHPDVQVENVFIGFNDLLPKLQAAAAGGDVPDVAAADLIWMPKLSRSGALIPLDADLRRRHEPSLRRARLPSRRPRAGRYRRFARDGGRSAPPWYSRPP
jgi:ABC-type glycerol-3-phosphate transport system substrate-binding protein